MKDRYAALMTQIGFTLLAWPIIGAVFIGPLTGIMGTLALLSFVTGGFLVGYGWADHGD